MREASHVVAQMMNELASSSYGPAGRSKVVQGSAQGSRGAVTVTSTSHRLFGALSIKDPIGLVLMQLLTARQERGSDCGLFTIMVATRVLLGATQRQLAPRLCTLLLPELMSQSLRAVLWVGPSSIDVGAGRSLPASAAFRVSHLPSLLAMVRTVMQPKHVAVPSSSASTAVADAARQMAFLLVEAFVSSLADEPTMPGRWSAEARVGSSMQLSPSESRAAAVLPGASRRAAGGRCASACSTCTLVRVPALLRGRPPRKNSLMVCIP